MKPVIFRQKKRPVEKDSLCCCAVVFSERKLMNPADRKSTSKYLTPRKSRRVTQTIGREDCCRLVMTSIIRRTASPKTAEVNR